MTIRIQHSVWVQRLVPVKFDFLSYFYSILYLLLLDVLSLLLSFSLLSWLCFLLTVWFESKNKFANCYWHRVVSKSYFQDLQTGVIKWWVVFHRIYSLVKTLRLINNTLHIKIMSAPNKYVFSNPCIFIFIE